ncbi:peptide chain release factor N(5)-glutamine methyltransferase [Tenacibaculum sp.]|uniref:peptide chain release factor N(5)-glutamine methyltransferase n=1 Tax=Tenacibaculum sp. TaxID=1906242 RepID=UPI003AA94410
MLLKQYKSYFSEELKSVFPQTEVDSFFFLLVEEYLDIKRIDLILQPNIEISSDIKELLDKALERLKKEEPIQYILGETEFYGLPFKVNKNTLIPRPETEELVEWIIKEVKKKQELLSILDIGTGTGCIPISLKKHLPNTNVSAIDISEEAIQMAKQNAKLNEVDISFTKQDILKTEVLSGMFDIIISNPPYVRELEKVEIKNNVLKNEPHLALFVKDDNPLLFYKKIADLAKNNLTKNGLLFFEINQYLGAETVEMLKNKGFTQIELQKDIFGNDRMIKASL